MFGNDLSNERNVEVVETSIQKTNCSITCLKRADKLNSLLIKSVFQHIIVNNNVQLVKEHNITDYFDKNTIELFFDLKHEHFDNIDVDIAMQLSDVDSDDQKIIDQMLLNIEFEDLKTNEIHGLKLQKILTKA